MAALWADVTVLLVSWARGWAVESFDASEEEGEAPRAVVCQPAVRGSVARCLAKMQSASHNISQALDHGMEATFRSLLSQSSLFMTGHEACLRGCRGAVTIDTVGLPGLARTWTTRHPNLKQSTSPNTHTAYSLQAGMRQGAKMQHIQASGT